MEHRAQEEEAELLDNAIEQLLAATGVDFRIVAREYRVPTGRRLDAVGELVTNTGKQTYAIEVKRQLTTATLGLVAAQLFGAPYKGMIVADYVNPKMAERLKEMDLAFIDLAGNAYLNEPPTYIYIRGNRPMHEQLRGPNLKPTKAFGAMGLKILFGFLNDPNLLQATYREIARATDVALGTVGWVLKDLREHGYLYEAKNRRRQFTEKRKVIEQWVIAYPEKLRPKLKLGRYRAPAFHWWKEVQLEAQEAQWGGEIGAAKLTNYLKPEKAVIYVDAIPPKLLAANRLKVDPEGDVEILRRFWQVELLVREDGQTRVPVDVVPPLLVYADLMATGQDRNIETARMIYDRFID